MFFTVFVDSPSNVTISGIMGDWTIDLNASISCSAAGYPEPVFEWKDDTSTLTRPGANMTVTELGLHTFTCIASNIIRGRTHVVERNITLAVTGTINFAFFGALLASARASTDISVCP